jgi:hypothetical protein
MVRPLVDRSKTCESCGRTFQYRWSAKQKFCSQSCAASVSNRIRVRNKKTVPLSPCLYCEEPTANRMYCSDGCHGKARSKKKIDEWLANPSEIAVVSGLPAYVRVYLIDLAGSRCTKCGWGEINPFTGKTTLEVDHIDGNCMNNEPGNLRVLCPNCHSLTETYKNTGNRRGQRVWRRVDSTAERL